MMPADAGMTTFTAIPPGVFAVDVSVRMLRLSSHDAKPKRADEVSMCPRSPPSRRKPCSSMVTTSGPITSRLTDAGIGFPSSVPQNETHCPVEMAPVSVNDMLRAPGNPARAPGMPNDVDAYLSSPRTETNAPTPTDTGMGFSVPVPAAVRTWALSAGQFSWRGAGSTSPADEGIVKDTSPYAGTEPLMKTVRRAFASDQLACCTVPELIPVSVNKSKSQDVHGMDVIGSPGSVCRNVERVKLGRVRRMMSLAAITLMSVSEKVMSTPSSLHVKQEPSISECVKHSPVPALGGSYESPICDTKSDDSMICPFPTGPAALSVANVSKALFSELPNSGRVIPTAASIQSETDSNPYTMSQRLKVTVTIPPVSEAVPLRFPWLQALDSRSGFSQIIAEALNEMGLVAKLNCASDKKTLSPGIRLAEGVKFKAICEG
mmetsp:Transcript_3992/g.8081  ORF Transcript_3992/g.8081 Transcript_3992/m.8081 type:complete len:433 (+) Transcript_3992:464-1762(+)